MPEEVKLQLNDKKIQEALEWYLKEAILFKDTEAAYRLVRLLPKYLTSTPPESPDVELFYQQMILKAEFIALSRLKVEEIAEVLKNNFSLVFELENYDLWHEVRAKLVAEPVYTERDEMKKKFRDALLSSEQMLTKEELVLGGVGVGGTVKNWLTDYNRAEGAGKTEALKMSEYLTNSPNTKSLSKASREKLDYLLKFYEKIKLSSLDYDGIEEPMLFNVEGKLMIFKEGQVEKISQDVMEMVAKATAAEEMAAVKETLETKYRGDEEEKKQVEEIKNKIIKSVGENLEELVSLLFEAVQAADGKKVDKFEIVAMLQILVEAGPIENLLVDKRFSDMLAAYLKKNKPTEASGFKINPRAPQYVSALLQYLLRDIAGMSEDDSGRTGMQILNILTKKGGKNKYQGLVYFDLEKKEFRWS